MINSYYKILDTNVDLLTTEEWHWLHKLDLGKVIDVQPLPEAITNQVFLLRFDNHRLFVFKRLNLMARDQHKRKHELAVQHLAYERGLSAKVVAYCQHYYLLSYIQGKVLSQYPRSDLTIKLLAKQLYRIHQLPALYAEQQALTQELLNLQQSLGEKLQSDGFEYFLHLAKKLDMRSQKKTLCHGDLSLKNLIREEKGSIKILDWEYSVLADPSYDLAWCCLINHFNQQQKASLIKTYYQLHRMPLSYMQFKQECELYLSIFTYINQLWERRFVQNH